MKLNVFLSGTIALLLTSQVFAQAPQEGFNGEAEAGAVIVSGGTDSESEVWYFPLKALPSNLNEVPSFGL